MEIKIGNKKIKVLQLVRRIIQIAALFLFPAFFALLFSSLKDISTAVVSGSFDVALHSRQLILVVGVLLITAFLGRFFCGFLCSFGAMADLFWFIRRKLRLPRPKIGEKVDKILKFVKYAVLVGIIALLWTSVVTIDRFWDPWNAFGVFTSIRGWSAASFANLLSVGGALFLLIIAGSLFVERFFCRYLCPLGAVLALVSRFRAFKIKKPSKHCELCHACADGCVMGIPLYGKDKVTSIECIDCFHCVDVCPHDNITANPMPVVVAVLTVGALAGVYYGGNLAMNMYLARGPSLPKGQTSREISRSTNPDDPNSGQNGRGGGGTRQPGTGATSGPMKPDGTYSAFGNGYYGPVYVTVTVSGGAITDIVIDANIDDPEYFNWAEANTIPNILAAQSIDVDAVAGATTSSEAIKEGVAKAMGWQ